MGLGGTMAAMDKRYRKKKTATAALPSGSVAA